MCAANTVNYMTAEPIKPGKTAACRRPRKSARALAVFGVTILFALIDSSMDFFTLEETARMVVACAVILSTGYVVVSGQRRKRSEFVAAEIDIHIEEVEEPLNSTGCVNSLVFPDVSTQFGCSKRSCADADFSELFDDLDSVISAELQGKFSTVMDTLESEQTQRLKEITFGAQDLTQEAVRAFDASYHDDKQRATRQMPAQRDVSIEEALDRLEQDVQRRRTVLLGQTRGSSKLNPMLIACVAGALGLCGACVDHLQAANIFSSTLVESGIVFVFMPMGYMMVSQLRLASSTD